MNYCTGRKCIIKKDGNVKKALNVGTTRSLFLNKYLSSKDTFYD